MSILTAVYVIIGGYKATAMNDFIQGIIMLFGICAVILAVLNAQGGLVAAVDKLAQIPSDADPSVNGGFASWFGPDPWGLLGVVILTSLGTMGLPQMVGKFYSITDESSAWKTDAGVYTFMICSSASDVEAKTTAKVKAWTKKVNNVMKPNVKLNLLKR